MVQHNDFMFLAYYKLYYNFQGYANSKQNGYFILKNIAYDKNKFNVYGFDKWL